MKIITSTLILLYILRISNSVRVGIIQNASLSINCSNLTINALTCSECLCSMIDGSKNMSILSLNCYRNSSNAASCTLFNAKTYSSSCFYQMNDNSNSTYYFQQLPSISQSLRTLDTTMQTATVSTTGVSDSITSMSGTTSSSSFTSSSNNICSRFTIQYNYNYPGSDINNTASLSLNGCCRWCVATSGCDMLVYYNASNHCWIKYARVLPGLSDSDMISLY